MGQYCELERFSDFITSKCISNQNWVLFFCYYKNVMQRNTVAVNMLAIWPRDVISSKFICKNPPPKKFVPQNWKNVSALLLISASSNIILIFLPCLYKAKLRRQGEKRDREVQGPLKKVLGLLDFFSPGTTGPLRSLGPVLMESLEGRYVCPECTKIVGRPLWTFT